MSFLVFFVFLEIIKRYFKINAEITRKLAHVLGGVGVIISSNYINKLEYLILVSLFFLLFTFLFKKRVLQSIHSISRKTYGELTYLLGLFVLGYFLFDKRSLFTTGLLVFIFPDAFSGLFLFLLKKNKKNLLSFVIFLTTALIILLMSLSFPSAFLMALILSIVEFFSPLGFDNFTIPLAYLIFINLLL